MNKKSGYKMSHIQMKILITGAKGILANSDWLK